MSIYGLLFELRKIPKDANFYPKCGTKAIKDVETVSSAVSGELKEALEKMSQEIEKAFAVAATEITVAF